MPSRDAPKARRLPSLALILAAAALVAAAAGPAWCSAGQRPSKPNVVWIFLDNVGYGDLGCYGNGEIRTPHADRLAEQGVLCTGFYIGSPSCMPSRGALLTGRHPVRNGLNEQIYLIDELEQVGLPRDEVILPRYLKEAGYTSGCFGKWNLGFAPGSRPTDRGFDEYFGNISGNCDYETYVYNGRNDLYRNTEPATADGYSTLVFAEAACAFIRNHRDRPFFCYVPFNAAHYPNPKNKEPGRPALWQAPDEYFHLYGDSPDTLDPRRRYRAVVSALDAGIGRVVDQIDELGLTENTLLVLLSDNGAFMIPGRGLECASNRPLKGGGTTLWEGGIRVPCIVRWPGRIKPGTVCREPLWSMDFVPMAIAAAGLPLAGDRTLDGKDPTAALAGRSGSPHEYLYWKWGSQSTAIRMGRYKLIRERYSRTRDFQLFDLQNDLGETKNLLAEKPDLARRLEAELTRWEEEAEAGR
ncbi:MAG: sulfatase-like hydrolase/transferase [Planctomycetota bacterium]|jgi:arylsulfatase A-like enzyme